MAKFKSCTFTNPYDVNGEIRVELRLISPEWAKEILATKNVSNRNRGEAAVNRYTSDIQNNAWVLTHQGIAFDAAGILIDGQTRLEAIAAADHAVWCFVFYGFPTIGLNNGIAIHTQDGVDRMRVRTTGQQLSLRHHIKNSNAIAAIAKVVGEICCGGQLSSITTPQTLKVLSVYGKQIEEVFSETVMRADRKAAICGTLAFARKGDCKVASEFAAAYFSMEGLTKNHPAIALRKYVDNHSTGTGGERWHLVKVVASAIKNFADGNSISRVHASDEALEWLRAKQKSTVRALGEYLSGAEIAAAT